MTEGEQQPSAVPAEQQRSPLRWAQFREDMLTSREVRRKAVIDGVRRFVDLHPMISRRPRVKAVIEARLQLREDLVTARFQFRRAVVRSRSQLVSHP
ncbi:MAG: hypothetical protein WBV80_09895 [Mycobacterium sp.]